MAAPKSPLRNAACAARYARTAGSEDDTKCGSSSSCPACETSSRAASRSTSVERLSIGPATLPCPLTVPAGSASTVAVSTVRAGEPTTLPMTTRSAPSCVASRTIVSRGTSIAGESPAARHAPSTAPASTERASESSASRADNSSTMPSRRYASERSAPATRNGATTTRCRCASGVTSATGSRRARPMSTPMPSSATMITARIDQRSQSGMRTSGGACARPRVATPSTGVGRPRTTVGSTLSAFVKGASVESVASLSVVA